MSETMSEMKLKKPGPTLTFSNEQLDNLIRGLSSMSSKTLRDEVAIAMLQGFASNMNIVSCKCSPEPYIKAAFEFSDIYMKEREKK